MSLMTSKDPKNSLILFEFDKYLKFLIKLDQNNKFPKVLLLSGKKGVGKFTLVNHFLAYIFDKNNYDLEKKTINSQSSYYKQYKNNVFSNIIYLSGNLYQNVKVEDIRNLKSTINKSIVSGVKRYIILDDIELFNLNSLNALLKMIEEPSDKDYFILINNKTKLLIDTIYSRSFELKILINETQRKSIIKSLIKQDQLEISVDFESLFVTPGNFLIFNEISQKHKIDVGENFLINFEKIINLYKKDKNLHLVNFIYYLCDIHFSSLLKNKLQNLDDIIESKSFVMDKINKLVNANLNQNSVLNSLSLKLSNG